MDTIAVNLNEIILSNGFTNNYRLIVYIWSYLSSYLIYFLLIYPLCLLSVVQSMISTPEPRHHIDISHPKILVLTRIQHVGANIIYPIKPRFTHCSVSQGVPIKTLKTVKSYTVLANFPVHINLCYFKVSIISLWS